MIQEIKNRLSRSKKVAALTGAGVSAESGVPTFRGEGGLWKEYRAEELATPGAFASDPKLVWEWYNWRREKLVGLEPNPAHHALAEIEKSTEEFTLITQNVDGLHRFAGSANLLELHGNIWRVCCTACNRVEENRDVPIAFPPLCSHCKELLRPHIVWFGETLPPEVFDSAMSALNAAELLLVIGTSGLVQPAASFASMVKSRGGFVVEINLEETPNSHLVDASLIGKAGEIVPQLLTERR